jgi:hypothetical protein
VRSIRPSGNWLLIFGGGENRGQIRADYGRFRVGGRRKIEIKGESSSRGRVSVPARYRPLRPYCPRAVKSALIGGGAIFGGAIRAGLGPLLLISDVGERGRTHFSGG